MIDGTKTICEIKEIMKQLVARKDIPKEQLSAVFAPISSSEFEPGTWVETEIVNNAKQAVFIVKIDKNRRTSVIYAKAKEQGRR